MNGFPGAEYLIAAIFGGFVAMTVAGGVLAVFTHRIIRSVCGLALCCVGLAGLYYFLNSPFLALMEILIYVGAVCVTIIFAVMLAEPDEQPTGEPRAHSVIWGSIGLGVAAAVFWGVTKLGLSTKWSLPATQVADGSVKAIGVSLLTTYSLAFEVISLVLLVAILGALVVARSGRSHP